VVAPCSSYGAKYFTRVGNQLQLSGTNYCLDAGTNPHDGVAMKLWQCGNYPQQQFIQQGPLLVTASKYCPPCSQVGADEQTRSASMSRLMSRRSFRPGTAPLRTRSRLSNSPR
jgi:hypothetical protein